MIVKASGEGVSIKPYSGAADTEAEPSKAQPQSGKASAAAGLSKTQKVPAAAAENGHVIFARQCMNLHIALALTSDLFQAVSPLVRYTPSKTRRKEDKAGAGAFSCTPRQI